MNPRQEQILLRLAASQSAVSGDTLAGELGLSRTGIWKHIQALRKQNINIRALPGKGYQLIGDAMTAATLKARLNTAVLGRHIEILAETDSTNAAAMRAAEEGAEEGMVVIATRQTTGRGRRGRLWHTFPEQALAMSILLRPALPPQHVPQLSLVTALALHDALSPYAPSLRIKWPNDLLADGHKLAGILTEMRAEPGLVHAVVIGIGINLQKPEHGWPEDIGQPVCDLSSLAGRHISRLEAATRTLDALDRRYRQYLQSGFEPIRHDWWQAHAANNRKVRVHDGLEYIEGIAESLDHDGALLVRTNAGIQRIIAGDLEIA